MVDSFTLERQDLGIVRALQIDPRAPFAQVASVLGLSEPTVSRRYARMRRAGALRVTGVVDPGALGQSQYLARLRCRPGSAAAIAEALAKRDDVSWVALSAAGAEVVCAVRSRSRERREDLLSRTLPRASAVLDLEASVILRQFVGGRGQYWSALAGVLTPEQEAQLGSAGDNPFAEGPVVRKGPPQLEEHDDRLLSALADDGRASLVDLAAAAGLTPGRASRRLQALVDDGVVDVHVELSSAALGYGARANLWLRVHPSAVMTVGRALAEMAEVGFVAAVSGRDNLHVLVNCRDLDELLAFTSERAGTLPGVQSAELGVVHRQVKQAGTLVTADRLELPARGATPSP